MVYEISEERKQFHAVIPLFMDKLKPRARIYDIGKSHLHDYRNTFREFNYKTIDRDQCKQPDLLIDIEKDMLIEGLPQVDAVICNGVIEQCDDPFKVIRSCSLLLHSRGYVLFGMVLLGYPPHENDRFRFTKNGAKAAIERIGLHIEHEEVITRGNVPSYIYAICRKK